MEIKIKLKFARVKWNFYLIFERKKNRKRNLMEIKVE